MSTTNENLNNFVVNQEQSFKDLEENVKRNEWSFKYDNISDILYFSSRTPASKESVLVPAGEDNCLAIRIGKKGNIESIVVENFGSIFVPENLEFQKLYDNLIMPEVEMEPVVVRRAYALILSDLFSAVRAVSPHVAIA